MRLCIEYEGQVRTYEELKEIEDQRLRELYPEDFTESSEEHKTETPHFDLGYKTVI